MRKTLTVFIVVALLLFLSGCESWPLNPGSRTKIDPATADHARNVDRKDKTTYRIFIGPRGTQIPEFLKKSPG